MKLDPARALRIIEGMVHERCDENPLLGDIYMIAHQGGEPSCAEKHPEWSTRALEIEHALVEAKIIPAWKNQST